jgi:hypothetical protein
VLFWRRYITVSNLLPQGLGKVRECLFDGF